MAREGDETGGGVPGFATPPGDATEFGGHKGQSEDWVAYGHTLTPAEEARAERRESPDPVEGRRI